MQANIGPQVQQDTIVNEQLTGRKTRRFKNVSGADIPAGSAVQLVLADVTHGKSGAIKIYTQAETDPHLICGGALQLIPAGGIGPVVVEGFQDAVNVVNGTAAGSQLIGGAADGRLAVIGGAFGIEVKAVAMLIEAPAGNAAAVRWLNPWGF